MTDDTTMTTEELAARWGCQPHTIHNMRARGAGPAYSKPTGKPIYLAEDVRAWEQAHRVEPGAGK